MSDFDLKKIRSPFANMYEAILESSRLWLPKDHMLNIYYNKSNSNKLYEDLVTYSRISHNIEVSSKINLMNPLQILANFYNITVHFKKGKYFTQYTPFGAKKNDIINSIFIQKKKEGYYVLIRR